MTATRLGKKTILFFKILANSNDIDLRLFWKIVLRVENGKIKCDKELALWGKLLTGVSLPSDLSNAWTDIGDIDLYTEELKNNWHRFLWKAKPLKVSFEGEDDGVTVVENQIEFNGGYLEIFDKGIDEDLETLGFPITQESPIFDGISEAVKADWSAIDVELIRRKLADNDDIYRSVGRNIYLETEYALSSEVTTSSEDEGSTIFYFCQHKDNDCKPNTSFPYVELRERIIAEEQENLRSIHWHIADEGFATKGQMLDISVTLFGNHLVTVNQDQDMVLEHLQYYAQDNLSPLEKFKIKVLEYLLKSENYELLSPYFEILVDTIPLQVGQENGMEVEQGAIGSFTSGAYEFPEEMIFYVGAKGPDSKNLFYGKLKHLVFDPNSSCDGCAG